MIAIKDNPSAPIQYKVILLGDALVGKTSIICRQLHGYKPQTTPTIGCHFNDIIMNVGQTQISMQVWDTAGQEMYRALVPIYLRGADAVIIVFDITDKKSFDNLNEWVEVAQNITTGIPIILLANKIDLENERAISVEIISNFAKKNNLIYLEASAKSGEGVEQIFLTLAQIFADRAARERKSDDMRHVDIGVDDKEKSKCC